MIYKVAIIGYGYWGPKLARNFHNSNNFKIQYIIDNSKKNLSKAKVDIPFCNLLTNYKSVKFNNIDLVVIATPTASHYRICKHLLSFTNVLVEKPLCLNSAQVNELEKIAKKNKKLLFVDYPFIFSGSINYIKKIIINNKYGKLKQIESYREQAPIRNDSDVIWDLGVHDISIFKYLLNSDPKILKSKKYKTLKIKKNDTAYINLEYKKNIKVFIKNSWISPDKIRLLKFKFNDAIIYCDENEPIYKIKIFTPKKELNNLYNLSIPEVDISEPLFNLTEYIAKCLRTKNNYIYKSKFNFCLTKTLEKI